jgi:porin
MASTDGSAFSFEAAYTGDVLSNVSGGLKRATRYLDNLDLTLEVDGDAALGWEGATFFLYGLYNNGTRFSETVAGDAQVISNIETGVDAARLYEAWIDQRFLDDRASLRLGLYDLNSEFDAVETAGLFINSAHGIGTDFAQSGENGPSIFPLTSLALRAEVVLNDNWLVRTAVLDGVPGDPAHPKRTAIKLGDGDGALLVGEVNFESGPVRSGFGYWRYTARFEDLVTGAVRRGNDGLYGYVEGRVYSEPGDADQGLDLFWRMGRASTAFNAFKRYYGLGAVYRGALAARPADDLGLAVAAAETSSRYRMISDVDSQEVSIELTYRAPIHRHMVIQPDIQYVFNPGLDPTLKNALVFGLRFELAWGAEG